MRQLIVRFLNVAVIAAVLIGYNTVLDKRDKEDQIARLSAELETTQLQKENPQQLHPTRRIRPQVKQQKQKGSTWTVRMTVKLTASAAPLQLK